MSVIDLRFPKITAETPEAQIRQLHSYVYQLVEQLNWALDAVGGGMSSQQVVLPRGGGSASAASEEADAQKSFASIKALIIKSADIVNAYSETITKQLEGRYEALSQFGAFVEETRASIEANSTNITQNYTNVQKLISEGDDALAERINELGERVKNAYIKTGLLDDDEQIYGVEVGETVDDGTFNKYARFTSDRLSFYDQNGTEVAYVSDYKLYITNMEVKGSFKLRYYTLDSSKGLAFKWVGDISG